MGTEGLFLDKVIVYTMSGRVLSLRAILLHWLSWLKTSMEMLFLSQLTHSFIALSKNWVL